MSANPQAAPRGAPATLPAPFVWQGEHIAIELGGAQVLFTTRRGGVSGGPFATLNLGLWTDDDPAYVGTNRDRLAELFGIERGRFAQGRQVHGTNVRRVTQPPEPDEQPAEADGQGTALAGIAPVVLVADCLPVALAGTGAVAMLHCGWRGLADGIVAEGVRALRELGDDGPVTAAVGPGARGCCYEVGEEVRSRFATAHPGALDGPNLDLAAVAADQLSSAGVEAVHDVALCTICSDPALFFSHRRDGGVTGRQAGVVRRA